MTDITPEQQKELNKLKPWDDTPKLTNYAVKTLSPISRNNDTLVAFLKSKKVTDEKLKNLILIEFVIRPTRRAYVVERCLGKLHTLQREKAERILNKYYYARKGNRT